MCIYVFATLYGTKKLFCCLFFGVKVSNALDTGAECESEEGKNIALLSLDNECMVQIPLGENTLASQLIINVLFFF